MSLEDYIQKKKSAPPAWIKFLYNIDNQGIDYDKITLIKEFKNYISSYNINYELCYLLDNGDTVIQIETTDGRRMAAEVELYKKEYNYQSEETEKKELTEAEYKERINAYKMVGSQNFYQFFRQYFYKKNDEPYAGILKIYYSNDGYIYVSDEVSKVIKDIDIDYLGELLAEEVANIDMINSISSYSHEDFINNNLRRRYEQCKIPKYEYKNEELHYLGPKLVKQK